MKKGLVNKFIFILKMTTISNDKNLCNIVNTLAKDLNKCNLKCKQNESVTVHPPQKGCFTTICYTPKNASGTISLTKTPLSTKKTVTTDANLVTIPANAIIDQIDFFGINGFVTKGTFSIGLGQLNDAIMMPLIESSDSTIALDKSGGCRQFISSAANGKNSKNLVLFQSNINIVLEHPITSGTLQVVIYYRMKPSSD
jgi:hypothetical protein